MSAPKFALRDLVYLDFDKAASIWSQCQQGLPDRMSVTEDSGQSTAAGTKFGLLSIAGANLGVDYLEKRSTLESRTLHHDVLNRVELHLADSGLVTDLSESLDAGESSADQVRRAIAGRPYLRAEGPSVVEDYRQILKICQKFNDLATFVGRSGQEGVKQSPEFKQLANLVAEAKGNLNQVKDRNQKAAQRQKVKGMERQLDELSKSKVEPVDQWIIDGIRLWIETFMSSRINFRVYPFTNCPSFAGAMQPEEGLLCRFRPRASDVRIR